MQLRSVQTAPEIQVTASQGTNWFVLIVTTGRGGEREEALRAASIHIYSIKQVLKTSCVFFFCLSEISLLNQTHNSIHILSVSPNL